MRDKRSQAQKLHDACIERNKAFDLLERVLEGGDPSEDLRQEIHALIAVPANDTGEKHGS
jgi:hypothetical protein